MISAVVDQAARDQIKLELNKNFLVEAGAGSGKTTSLVERMVQLVLTETCAIDQIAAITFTKKAADELKIRFQTKLEEAWKVEDNAKTKYVLGQALQNIERCYMGTVHSFCARLLRERPIEANLDLDFSEVEDRDDIELLEEAWQLFLRRLQNEQSLLLEEMDALGIKVDDLFASLCELRKYPDVEWVADEVDKPELLSAYQELMPVVREAKGSIPFPPIEGRTDDLQNAILAALRKDKHLDASNDRDLISLFELFNKNLKRILKLWKSNEDCKFYEGKINDILEKSVKPRLQGWREYCHPKIIMLLKGAIGVYEELKRERSILNFQDLLLKAAYLLRENPEVRGYFQEKYKCLLVDEFQDTDPIQAELMFYLTSEDLAEKNWTECKPKQGSLFVVGDPKQAIYRFRRADIDTYNRVKHLIETHGGEVLQLTMNFRTLDSVTDALNSLFADRLPETETETQAAYRPLHSYKRDQGEGLSGIKKLTVPAEISKKEDIVSFDSAQIADAVSKMIAQGCKPCDFMVLTRYNDGMATYARRIEAKGIPVSISGEIIIGEMAEIQELSILLNAFVDPSDEVSLVAALRGIFYGISDNDLYQWKLNGGRFSIFASIPERLDDKSKTKFEAALSKLQQYQKWVNALPPTVAIEKIIEDTGFYPLLLASAGNKGVYKSLLQVIEHLRRQEMLGKTTYHDAFSLLKEIIEKKTAVLNIEEGSDAVRIMNIHKAKGLEAKYVFLAHPAMIVETKNKISMHIKRESNSSKGYFSFSVEKSYNNKKEIAIPLDWETHKAEEYSYLKAEELRILYVAATRPENALVISSSAKNNGKNPWGLLLGIGGVEELNLPEVDVPEQPLTVEDITLADFHARTGEGLHWLEDRIEKSFDYWSPTKEKDFTQLSAIDREAGGGKDWGTIIHHVFEKVVKGLDVTAYIPNLLAKYVLPPEQEAEVYKAISVLKKSAIWQELSEAEHILTEVPITLNITAGHPLYELVAIKDSTTAPIQVKGVIDLIYKRGGAWKIVDYKTDRPKEASHFKDLEAFYHGQIHFYKRAWEEITGEKVTGAELFFVMKEEL